MPAKFKFNLMMLLSQSQWDDHHDHKHSLSNDCDLLIFIIGALKKRKITVLSSVLFSQHPIFTSNQKSVREFDCTQMGGNSSEMTVAELNHRTWEYLHVADAFKPIWQILALCLNQNNFNMNGGFCKACNQHVAIILHSKGLGEK